MKVVLGDEFKLYLDTSGDPGVEAWIEVDCIDELGFDPAPITAQINRRGRKTPGYIRGRLETTLSCKAYNVPDSVSFQALESAIWDTTRDGTEILHLALVRGELSVTGNDMWDNDFVVTGAPLDGSLDEGASYDIELKPAADTDKDHTQSVT